MISLQAGFLFSCISSFASHWLALGLFKFVAVCFSCAANSVTYTLVGESCSQRVRSKHMLMMTGMLLLGPAFGAVIAYPTINYLNFEVEIPWLSLVFRPWRLLIIILALPCGICGVAIMFFHESPKFLANWGRKEEALEVLRSMYAVNHWCDKDEYKVHAITVEESAGKREGSVLRAMYAQCAPLFRPPYVVRTAQLFYLVAVAYITNNTFLVWLPHILGLVRVALESSSSGPQNICSLISLESKSSSSALNSTYSALDNFNSTMATTDVEPPRLCAGRIEENTVLTLLASQSVFALLNLAISFLPQRRKALLVGILLVSSASGVLLNLTPEAISSVVFLVLFTCTCLTMGILASYFVDLYPTSYRGMVSCLSIMVGRTSTFVGINVAGNYIFHHCTLTTYLWSLLVLSSAVTAMFLPPDKPPTEATRL